MASLIRVPIDFRAPEQTGLAGNSFWTIASGVASQMGMWQFLGNTSGGSGTGIRVTSAAIFGFVQVPSNVDPGSIPVVVLALGTSATAGGVGAFRVGTRDVLVGETFDVTSFVQQDTTGWTAPTTAWARLDLLFSSGSATTANSLIAIRVERPITLSGSGVDTLTGAVGLFDAYISITATG